MNKNSNQIEKYCEPDLQIYKMTMNLTGQTFCQACKLNQ